MPTGTAVSNQYGTGDIAGATTLKRYQIQQWDENGLLPSDSGGGASGSAHYRKYSFASFIASIVAASLRARGLPPNTFTSVVEFVRDMPGLKGRGEPENGKIRVFHEDVPNYLVWAGNELRGVEEVEHNPLSVDTTVVIPMRGILIECIARLQKKVAESEESRRATENALGEFKKAADNYKAKQRNPEQSGGGRAGLHN